MVFSLYIMQVFSGDPTIFGIYIAHFAHDNINYCSQK